MALWPVHLRRWSGQTFRTVEPRDVLAEYEQPLTFTFADADGSLVLAHLLSRSPDRLRYVVAPTTAKIVEQLSTGARSIRAALDQPMVWLMDVAGAAAVAEVWVGNLADLPARVLPGPDVMLYPHLTPLLRLRAIGPQIEPGSLPARVVRSVVAGAENAIRTLTNFVTDHVGTGRPRERHRQLYQLQAQQFAFRSFEVAFRPIDPSSGQLIQDAEATQVVDRVQAMLGHGLLWAQTGESPSADARENQAIFEAIRELSPTVGSPVSRVEVGGRVADTFGGVRPILSVTTRRLANESIGHIRARKPLPNYIVSVGRVVAIDRAASTVTVVGTSSDRQGVFGYDSGQLDDVLDALNASYDVTAVGVPEHGMPASLIAFYRLDDAPPSDASQ